MGGTLYAISSNLSYNLVKFINIDDVDVIYLKSKFESFILPVYLNYNCWDSDFLNLSNFLSKMI